MNSTEIIDRVIDRTPIVPHATVKLGDLYDTYQLGSARFNKGELVSVPVEEAERLVKIGAAVRISGPGVAAETEGNKPAHQKEKDEKAIVETKNKMVSSSTQK